MQQATELELVCGPCTTCMSLGDNLHKEGEIDKCMLKMTPDLPPASLTYVVSTVYFYRQFMSGIVDKFYSILIYPLLPHSFIISIACS